MRCDLAVRLTTLHGGMHQIGDLLHAANLDRISDMAADGANIPETPLAGRINHVRAARLAYSKGNKHIWWASPQARSG